ncbi:hypothetical protein J6590_075803 [Homalodisca vitripennis]|nr:hypothetical protein J6590_075803 [Homalodisca vitripennis]
MQLKWMSHQGGWVDVWVDGGWRVDQGWNPPFHRERVPSNCRLASRRHPPIFKSGHIPSAVTKICYRHFILISRPSRRTLYILLAISE